jgi:hypothetical protein
MGFFGPQLVVVSGLFGGNPLMDGIFWATTCCCLRPLFSLMEFWLLGSLFHELFLFSRWNSGYHEAFSHELFIFSRWISGYHDAFSHELFLFSRWNFRDTQFGGRLFSYIYHKEYLHRIRLVKNLAS